MADDDPVVNALRLARAYSPGAGLSGAAPVNQLLRDPALQTGPFPQWPTLPQLPAPEGGHLEKPQRPYDVLPDNASPWDIVLALLASRSVKGSLWANQAARAARSERVAGSGAPAIQPAFFTRTEKTAIRPAAAVGAEAAPFGGDLSMFQANDIPQRFLVGLPELDQRAQRLFGKSYADLSEGDQLWLRATSQTSDKP